MNRAVSLSIVAVGLTLATLVIPAFATPEPAPAPTSTATSVPTRSASASAWTGELAPGLRPKVLRLALEAQRCAVTHGLVKKPELLTVIDYSLPSTKRRLWVLDLAHHRLLFHELVAHGKGSGGNRATRFSNTSMSLESSLGLMVTAETYYGKNGYSLRLDGQTPGFNDQARDRAIVMHGADYVSRSFIRRVGRLGRSWGCPALPRGVARPVIDAIKGGSVLFGYYPDRSWIDASPFLSCQGAGGVVAAAGGAAAGTR
jgi:hypothetical protein